MYGLLGIAACKKAIIIYTSSNCNAIFNIESMVVSPDKTKSPFGEPFYLFGSNV